MNSSKNLITALFVSGILCLFLSADVRGQEEKEATAPSNQKMFDTPEQAVASLIEAAAAFDVPALKEILGPEGESLINSEDPVKDKELAISFGTKGKENRTIEITSDYAILSVGDDVFPLPIPIVKYEGKWYFDTVAGVDEILLRRIGSNELDAITICRGYNDVQLEYARQLHDDSKINQYAQRVISTQGKQDGLAWQNEDGTWGGPVGEEIAKALEQGYSQKDKPQPYHGYYFKILKGQGPSAPNGEVDFVVGGAMIGGFALAAAPAEYEVTGVKTFIVSHSGIVYEKDLGPETLEIFEKMDRFDPDVSWQPTEDQWEE